MRRLEIEEGILHLCSTIIEGIPMTLLPYVLTHPVTRHLPDILDTSLNTFPDVFVDNSTPETDREVKFSRKEKSPDTIVNDTRRPVCIHRIEERSRGPSRENGNPKIEVSCIKSGTDCLYVSGSIPTSQILRGL